MTTELPKGWTIKPLRELLISLESGKRPKGGVKGIESGIPSLGGEHLNSNGNFKLSKIKYVPETFANTMKRGKIQNGDILVVKDGATTGKTSFVGSSFPFANAVVNEHVFACRCREGVDPKYVFYFLYSAEGNRQILQDFRGAAQGGISQKFAELVNVPLAPLDLQKSIVAEIEKQFSRLDEAVASLKRVKANLKRYKAAVLKAAVEGRLVATEAELARRLLARDAQASEGCYLPTPRPGVFYVYAIRCVDDSIYIGHTDNLARRWEEHLAGLGADWTKQHKPIQIVHYEEYTSRQEAADREKWLKTGYGCKWIKREIKAGRARQVGYETGAQLLQRILETRRRQWLASAEKAGRKGKGKYKEPAAPDTTDLPTLPEGWTWATVDQLLASLRNGLSRKPEDSGPGIPVLRISSVRPLELDTHNYRYYRTKPNENVDDYLLERGNVLFVRYNGTKELVGVCALVRQVSGALLYPDKLIRGCVVDERQISPSYLAISANIGISRKHIDKLIKTTAGQHGIAGSEIKKMPIPLPPHAEQLRIVVEIDQCSSLVRETEAQVSANLQRAERLRQFILHNAFSGKVMPLDYIRRPQAEQTFLMAAETSGVYEQSEDTEHGL
ncbi:MAG: GIY-YIG nuclease family protein [Gammaproteobacteria bacterium]|nr:GIY-YIG nuclease family protein [Gammaproteobacteria bacterium]